MATYLRLTNATTGETVLVNMDTVSTVYPRESGSRLFFIGEPDRMFEAVESPRDIGGVLGAQSA